MAKGGKPRVSSADVALQWLAMGIYPVPLKPQQKVPKNKGWPTLRVTKETVHEFFSPGDNVGGIWGEPSGWIVDLDLDWDEAATAAAVHLPKTFVYGRLSRPNTHYLFRVKGAITSKRRLREGGALVEIRSTGSQSVLPPSVYPNGERYEINQDEPIKTLTRQQLENYASELAALAVLIKHFPDEGSRHDFIHAVTGGLMYSGWPEERVTRFMTTLVLCTTDDDPEQRERTIKNTIDHFKQGDRVQGWRSLQVWIDGAELKALREWLTPSKIEIIDDKMVIGQSKLDLIPKFDTKLLDVPGLVGEITDWASRQSYLEQPPFDLAVGLMCTAIISCNKYRVGGGWNTPLQPYFMLVAPTAGGKGAALSSTYKFSKLVGMDAHVYQGFQSYYAMLDQLADPPNQACWLWDEAARNLAAARSPGSPDFTTVTHLTSLYGRANESIPAIPGRRNHIPALENPFLTLLATAQPTPLVESITNTDVTTGFINRLVLFDAGDVVPHMNLERSDVVPFRMKKAAMLIKSHDPRGIWTEIGMDTPTYNYFIDYEARARAFGVHSDQGGLWGRALQNALILSGLVAIGISAHRPVITQPIAEWACALLEWSIKCWAARVGDEAKRTVRGRNSMTVERCIRASRTHAHRARQPKQAEQMSRGLMPRAVLMRIMRHLQKKELDEILDNLVESEQIGAGEDEKTGGITYWPR